MKERPILFNADMVGAVLAGRKTQTRRVVKPPGEMKMFPEDIVWWDDDGDPPNGDGSYRGTGVWECDDMGGTPEYIACPYGQPGDELWVRESFFDVRPFRHAPLFAAVEADFIYRSDHVYREDRPGGKVIGCHKWTPSIFMPREASRIQLEIIDIRIERIQSISEADAKSEGVFGTDWGHGNDYGGAAQYRPAFQKLWESINAKRGYGWEVNPWVWVVEFRKKGGES